MNDRIADLKFMIEHYQSNIEVSLPYPNEKENIEYYKAKIETLWQQIDHEANKVTLRKIIKTIFQK